MPPKNPKPLSKTELAAHETRRDLAADLLQSVKEMKAGKVVVVTVPVVASTNSSTVPAATRK